MPIQLSREERETIEYCHALREIVFDERWDIEALSLICRFADELHARYPEDEVRTCRLYHVLIGSTFDTEHRRFDLPGGDSVVLFLERLAAQFDPERAEAVKASRRNT